MLSLFIIRSLFSDRKILYACLVSACIDFSQVLDNQHKNGGGARASLLWRKVEKVGDVQPVEVKAAGPP